MVNVLVVGMAVADFLFEVDSMPVKPEKYIARDASVVGGGGAANAACAIARLGGSATLAARVGGDVFGGLLLDDLKNRGVDCSQVLVSAAARTSFSSVLLDAKGDRQIVNFRGSDLSEDLSMIKSAKPDAVLSDTRWQAGTRAAMELAVQHEIPGVLDAEAPLDFDAMALASHIAFSKQGLESFAGELTSVAEVEGALRKVAKICPAWLAVTDGGNGVYTLTNGTFSHVPVADVDVVDTLGAGDVWHGAFALSLAGGKDEEKSVRFASAAATLKCTVAGGGRACPDHQEVTTFLRTGCSR